MGDDLTAPYVLTSPIPVPHVTAAVERRQDFWLRGARRRFSDRFGKDGVRRRRRRRRWILAYSAALLSRDCQGELVELCARQIAKASGDLGDEVKDHPRQHGLKALRWATLAESLLWLPEWLRLSRCRLQSQ